MIHRLLETEERIKIAVRGAERGLSIDNIQVRRIELLGQVTTASVHRNGDFFEHALSIGDKGGIRYAIHASDLHYAQFGKFIYHQLAHNLDKVRDTFHVTDIYEAQKNTFHDLLDRCKNIQFVDRSDDRLFKAFGGTVYLPPVGRYEVGEIIQLRGNLIQADHSVGAEAALQAADLGAVSFSSPKRGEALRFGLLIAKKKAQANGMSDKASNSLVSKLASPKEGRIKRFFRHYIRDRLISRQFHRMANGHISNSLWESSFRITRL